jgi:large subunit ribosomal protein L5
MKQTFFLLKRNCNPRNYEDFYFNYKLDYITKFNTLNTASIKQCGKIILNFGFKHFRFEKKQMALYFFLLELLSNQKCILTVSRKNNIQLKLKKGSVTGCKLTLRSKNFYIFLDTLLLGLPRSEMFKGFVFKNLDINSKSFSTKLSELFVFQALELEITPLVKTIDLTFNFNSLNFYDKNFFFLYYKIPVKYLI